MTNRFTSPIKRKKDKIHTVCIFAGAYGYRMTSYGIPCLHVTNTNETILDRQIRLINEEFGSPEIIVCIKHEADKVIKAIAGPSNVRFVENQLLNSNEAEDMRLVINNIPDHPTLFMFGDSIFDYDALKDLSGGNYIVSLGNKTGNSQIGIVADDNMVSNMNYGFSMLWSGIFCVNGELLKTLKQTCTRNKSNLFIYEILNQLIDGGTKISVITKNVQFQRLESIKELNK